MRIEANGILINYVVEGDGPWVTMSHSLACNLHMWDEEAKRLSKNFRVLRFDTRGHGKSSAPPGPYTLDMLADDLFELLQALGVSSTHLVGLSMGGMIGQVFAAKYPGIASSLVLCDSSGRLEIDMEDRFRTIAAHGLEPLVAPTMARFFSEWFRKQAPRFVENVARMMRSTPTDGYVGCCHAIRKINLLSRLSELRCPALVMVGSDDVATPVQMSEELHRAIPGSELIVLENAAHLSNLEQPVAFGQALEAFLQRQHVHSLFQPTRRT